jgi:hypothetical protein
MATWIVHVLRRNCLLKGVIEGNIEGRIEVEEAQENVSSYWVTLGKREDTVNLKRKH